MSARPGRIIDRIEVGLPRPRTYEMMAGAGFRPAARPHLAADPGRRMMPAARGAGGDHPRCCWRAWEVLPRAGLVPALFLPPLSTTLAAAASDWHGIRRRAWRDLVARSRSPCCSPAAAGCLAGAAIGSLPRLRTTLLPVVSSLYAVPLVILYPVLTVWLGIGPAIEDRLRRALRLLPDHAGDRGRHPHHRPQPAARRPQHGRDAAAADHARRAAGLDPDRARRAAAGRRAGDRRRGGGRDAGRRPRGSATWSPATAPSWTARTSSPPCCWC